MIHIAESVKARLSAEDINSLVSAGEAFDQRVKEFGDYPFKPRADYFEDMDCIRVVLRDCSICEYRINPFLTIWHDNDPNSDPSPVGFALKGVKACFADSDHGVVKLTKLFAELANKFPTEDFLACISQLKKITHQKGLEDVAVPA